MKAHPELDIADAYATLHKAPLAGDTPQHRAATTHALGTFLGAVTDRSHLTLDPGLDRTTSSRCSSSRFRTP